MKPSPLRHGVRRLGAAFDGAPRRAALLFLLLLHSPAALPSLPAAASDPQPLVAPKPVEGGSTLNPPPSPSPAPPAELISPAHQLIPGHNDADWLPLFASFRAHENVYATFTENRHLPFKKIPAVFTGEMRFSPARGLSLHYLTPQDRLMILDTQGTLLRDDRGRSRTLPADPRSQAATLALLHVMRFDLPALAKNFELYAARDGATWQLALVPRDTDSNRLLSRLVVTGRDSTLEKIEMRKSAQQSVEILINETRPHATFTPEELARFFR